MTVAKVRRLLAIGDIHGIRQLLSVIPSQTVCGLVCAGIRPQYHDALRDLAEQRGLPLLIQPVATSKAYPAFADEVKKLKPDLIIVNSYSMLLRKDILAVPKYGALNIHGALLPQYRGCNPIQWALLNNETGTGVTMHYMSAEFDTGDIVAQRQVPMFSSDTWRDVQARIAQATEAMLTKEMPALLTLSNTRHPQDQDEARYYKRRHPEDGLIDWSKDSVLHAYNLVRALVKPHPGAFYFHGSEKVVLDEYLTLQQVATIKYGESGGQELVATNLRLTPVGRDEFAIISDALWKTGQMAIVTDRFGSIWQEWVAAPSQNNRTVMFGIRSVKTGQLNGACGLHSLDISCRSAELELLYLPTPESLSRDCAEAIRLALRVAFIELGLERVGLHVRDTDGEIVATVQECGFAMRDEHSGAGYGYGKGQNFVAVKGSDRECRA
jgi:methionyl-tRNA formyltransferase